MEQILRFWFEELTQKDHFKKDPVLDTMMRDRFEGLHTQAMAGELWGWRSSHEGRLAEIILLDQFSRNMFRDTPKAFGSDTLALVLAQEAVRANAHLELERGGNFILMPYMHSESKSVHEEAVRLFSLEPFKGALEWEIKHKAIVDQYGRYPHRNEILGRESTPEEVEFLKGPGSSF